MVWLSPRRPPVTDLLILAGLILERDENHKSNECQSSVKIQMILDLGLETSDIEYDFFFRGWGEAHWGWKPGPHPCQTLILPLSCTLSPTWELQYVFQVLVKEIRILMERNFRNEANL